jgi:hypothetical protein
MRLSFHILWVKKVKQPVRYQHVKFEFNSFVDLFSYFY